MSSRPSWNSDSARAVPPPWASAGEAPHVRAKLQPARKESFVISLKRPRPPTRRVPSSRANDASEVNRLGPCSSLVPMQLLLPALHLCALALGVAVLVQRARALASAERNEDLKRVFLWDNLY